MAFMFFHPAIMRFVFFVIILLFSTTAWSQEFSKEEQYKQALQNAKTAFEAKQYSQAVLFYREAQQIKPESLLPRYKIEDIRTIYIEKEQIAYYKEHPVEVKKKEKLSKKEKLAQQKKEEEQLRQKATIKMDRDAEAAKKEMNTLKVTDAIKADEGVVADTLLVEKETLIVVRESGLNPIEIKKQESIQGSEKVDSNPSIIVEKRDIAIEIPVQKYEAVPTKVETVPAKKEVPKQNKNTVDITKPAITHEKKAWIEQEQKRLATTYPNKKTVEEMDKPGKHITRIIMNIDNKVTIYLKVHHSWGATFFFIDETGQDLKSINEQYFNLMTNLNTYGN